MPASGPWSEPCHNTMSSGPAGLREAQASLFYWFIAEYRGRLRGS